MLTASPGEEKQRRLSHWQNKRGCDDFSRPHGQFCVCDGTPQRVSCDPRKHVSGAPVSTPPAPSPPDSWESTWFGTTCTYATCPEILQRSQSFRGHPDPDRPDTHWPRQHHRHHRSLVLHCCLTLRRLCLLGRHLVHHFRIPLSGIRTATKIFLPVEG